MAGSARGVWYRYREGAASMAEGACTLGAVHARLVAEHEHARLSQLPEGLCFLFSQSKVYCIIIIPQCPVYTHW